MNYDVTKDDAIRIKDAINELILATEIEKKSIADDIMKKLEELKKNK
jgi:hypothetical protein